MQLITFTLTALALVPQAFSAGPVCKNNPYNTFLPLAKDQAAQKYCHSRFPVPCVTSTTTLRPKLKTVTVFASTTTPAATITNPITIDTTTIEPTTGTTSIPTTVDTSIITSVVSTLTSIVTEITSTTTILADFTPIPDKAKRDAPAPYGLFKQLQARSPSCIKTACSCIQTPTTKIVTVTPKPPSVTKTQTRTIKATMTDVTSVTAQITSNIEQTVQVPVTATITTSITISTTSTSTGIATTTSICPSSAPNACTLPAFGGLLPQCIDLQTNANSCGVCGNRCDTGTICQAGQCSLPPVCNSEGIISISPAPEIGVDAFQVDADTWQLCQMVCANDPRCNVLSWVAMANSGGPVCTGYYGDLVAFDPRPGSGFWVTERSCLGG